jgi:hypothetical protein
MQYWLRTFGKGMNITEGTRLNKNEYDEKTYQTIRTDWNRRISGMRTINRAGDVNESDCIYAGDKSE